MVTEIDELDELAKKFIIGHIPFTKKQKDILQRIKILETQLQTLEVRRRRKERELRILYVALAQEG